MELKWGNIMAILKIISENTKYQNTKNYCTQAQRKIHSLNTNFKSLKVYELAFS